MVALLWVFMDYGTACLGSFGVAKLSLECLLWTSVYEGDSEPVNAVNNVGISFAAQLCCRFCTELFRVLQAGLAEYESSSGDETDLAEEDRTCWPQVLRDGRAFYSDGQDATCAARGSDAR